MEEEDNTTDSQAMQEAALLFRLLGVTENALGGGMWQPEDDDAEVEVITQPEYKYVKRNYPHLKYWEPKKKGRLPTGSTQVVQEPHAFNLLSEELVLHIFSYLRPKELLAMGMISRSLDNTLWQPLVTSRWPSAEDRTKSDQWWLVFESSVARACLQIIFGKRPSKAILKPTIEVFDTSKPKRAVVDSGFRPGAIDSLRTYHPRRDATKQKLFNGRRTKRISLKTTKKKGKKSDDDKKGSMWMKSIGEEEGPYVDISRSVNSVYKSNSALTPETVRRVTAEVGFTATCEGCCVAEKLREYFIWEDEGQGWVLDERNRVVSTWESTSNPQEPTRDIMQVIPAQEITSVSFGGVLLRVDMQLLTTVLRCMTKLKKRVKSKARTIRSELDACEQYLENRSAIDEATVVVLLEDIYEEFLSLPPEIQMKGLELVASEVAQQTPKGRLFCVLVGVLNGAAKSPSVQKTRKTFLKQAIIQGEGNTKKEASLLSVKMAGYCKMSNFAGQPSEEEFDLDDMKRFGKHKDAMRKVNKLMSHLDGTPELELLKSGSLKGSDSAEEGAKAENVEERLFEWLEVVYTYHTLLLSQELRTERDRLEKSLNKLRRLWSRLRLAADV